MNFNIRTIGICFFVLASIFCLYQIWSLNGEKAARKLIKTELKLVSVFGRHGDRGPADGIPESDPHGARFDFFWPNGWGNLTESGKHRQYKIGLELRRHYGKYLDYNSSHVLAFSSPSQRCIESLTLTLKGMFDMSQPAEVGRLQNSCLGNLSTACAPSGSGSPDEWKKVIIDTDSVKGLVYQFLEDCKYRKNNPSPLDKDLFASPNIRALPGTDLLAGVLKERYQLEMNKTAIGYFTVLVSEMNLVRTAETLNYSRHYLDWINRPLSTTKKTDAKLFDLYEQVTFLAYRDRVVGDARYIQLSPAITSLIESQSVALGRNITNDRMSHYKNKKIILYSSHDSILQLILDTLGVIHYDSNKSFESRLQKWTMIDDPVGKFLAGLKMSEYGMSFKFDLYQQTIDGSNKKYSYVQMFMYNHPDGQFHSIHYRPLPFGAICRRVFMTKHPKAKNELNKFYNQDFQIDQQYDCPFEMFLNITSNYVQDDQKLKELCGP